MRERHWSEDRDNPLQRANMRALALVAAILWVALAAAVVWGPL